ncbi:hypothetical protein IAD21_02629 [Abditibacteriota bacterium]|nr:hypothetical protein IAD21_02629 [Abditibacteriota bacterium]
MMMLFRRSASRGRDFSDWFWPRGLLLLSLGVLAVPIALWSAFWLRAPWSVAMVVILVAALWTLGHGSDDVALDLPTRRELRATAWWAFVPLALMCFGSGIGGWGYQSSDWNKHNAVLADLVRFEWPVRYMEAPDAVHLTYYTAFYLPAALVGKVFGWTGALVAHQLGALVVMGLLAAWLAWLGGPRVKWIGVVFAGFGGMDYLAAIIGPLLHGGMPQLVPFSREWWEKPILWWAYYAHATELFWVPHTALAGWLGSAILLRGTSPLRTADKGAVSSENWNDLSFDLVACALLPLWSPWAWIGCLVLLGVRVVQQRRTGRSLGVWPWVFMVAVWGMQFGYLMSRLPLPKGVTGVRGYRPSFAAPGLIREFGVSFFSSWLAFSLVEFGVFALLCVLLWRRAKFSSSLAPFLLVSVLMLVALPLFQYGLYNDLLRAAVVPLVVLCLSCVSALRVSSLQGVRALKTVLVVALGIGGLHSIQYAIYFAHTEKEDMKAHRLVHLPNLKKTPTVYGLYAHDHRPQLLTQYIGRDDSVWARWFLKP